MSSLTTNFSFILPAVNDPTDEDLWGGYLNSNWTALDTYLKTARDNETLSKTADYTVTTSDRNKAIIVDASSADVTLSLPAAATDRDWETV